MKEGEEIKKNEKYMKNKFQFYRSHRHTENSDCIDTYKQ